MNGWTCSQCGSWVPSGVTHTCVWGSGGGGAYKADPTWMLLNAVQGVHAELKRIADTLQQMNGLLSIATKDKR